MAGITQEFADPHLFILADAELIASANGLTQRLCQIEKHPTPVIVADTPWEGMQPDGSVTSHQDPFFAKVLYDDVDELYKCWYTVANRFSQSMYAEGFANQDSSGCYAISRDGINWEKPVLRQVLHKGSLENNMMRLVGPPGSGLSAGGLHSIIRYSSDDSDDRFVASTRTGCWAPGYPGSMTVWFSSDGMNWRGVYPPVMTGDGETHAIFNDRTRSQYICTSRSAQYGNLCRRWGRELKRSVSLARSRDLMHWTPLIIVFEVDEHDPEDAQVYNLKVLPYGHGYLGVSLMFYTNEMVLDNQLIFSRDLMNWQRVGNRQPFLARGEEGTWDCRHVTLANTPPALDGDTLRFWYGGKNTPHYQAGCGAMGTGTLIRDRFVCYEAGEQEGVLTTVPMKLDGPLQVELNVDASDGEIRVEVLGEDESMIPGYQSAPVTGDHVRVPVQFKGGELPEDIRLRFRMRNAKLYAFKAPLCI